MNQNGSMDNNLNQIDSIDLISKHLWKWMIKLYAERELLFMHLHIICSAIFPIFLGAHASLRCPSSAKAPKKYSNKILTEDEDVDEELMDSLPKIQGLEPSDAIVMPALAGIALGSLYLLIKWLDDPRLLNRILNWYFSGVGVVGVGKLLTDTLNVITTFIFPSVWSTKKEIFFVDSVIPSQLTSLDLKPRENGAIRRSFETKNNPFPGLLSSAQFPISVTSRIWTLRALFTNQWVFECYIKNFTHTVKLVRLNDVVGFTFGLGIIINYNIYTKSWWLNNMIAFGFCYEILQILSPRNFWTGSLVLFGLFIYDITMVFYTPLMVTVATSLDVPIKLVFPGPNRTNSSQVRATASERKYGSMLGLGDIVLPGLMIALALRFDLYLHYLSKQRLNQHANQKTLIKPNYTDATGFWGERFWTSRFKPNSLYENPADGGNFKKVYFWTGIFAYVIGLSVTQFVMTIFKHAQPALLYLVPGVVFALWGAAWTRGEVLLMWSYSEDDESDSENEKDGKDKIQPDEKIKTQLEVDPLKDDIKVTDLSLSIKKKRQDWYAERIFSFSLKVRRTYAEKMKNI